MIYENVYNNDMYDVCVQYDTELAENTKCRHTCESSANHAFGRWVHHEKFSFCYQSMTTKGS